MRKHKFINILIILFSSLFLQVSCDLFNFDKVDNYTTIKLNLNNSRTLLIDSAGIYKLTITANDIEPINLSSTTGSFSIAVLSGKNRNIKVDIYDSTETLLLFSGEKITDLTGSSVNISLDVIRYARKLEYLSSNHTGGDVPPAIYVNKNSNTTIQGNSGSLIRSGYTFIGWNSLENLSGTTYYANQEINVEESDITLYAVWTAVYNITYNLEGGSVPSSINQTGITEGTSITLDDGSTVSRDGFTFVAWSLESMGEVSPSTYTMSSFDVTFYAIWSPKTYFITFDGNGDVSGEPSFTQEVIYNESSILTSEHPFFNEGEIYFAGWNTSSDGYGDMYENGGSYTHTVPNDITLYAIWTDFFSATFNVAGGSGAFGPTQSQLDAYYIDDPDLSGKVTNIIPDDGYQKWTVPVTGNYTIKTYGAQGGQNGSPSAPIQGAYGAIMRGDFYLKAGDQLVILVGQHGTNSVANTYSSAGGGGSFVTVVDTNSTFIMEPSGLKVKPLIIAGGGGGVGGDDSKLGVQGSTNTSGTKDSGGFGSFGTSGSGGLSGSISNTNGGGGGGGFIDNGTSKQANSGFPGSSFLNGGVGGASSDGSSSFGGFGGGAGNQDTAGGGGAGGGYSGGSGGQYESSTYYGGGGGGSYNSGSNQDNSGYNTGQGRVEIYLNSPNPS